MPHRNPHLDRTELEQAIRKLVEVLEEGLDHGFFDYSVTGEIVRGGIRCVTVRAGKSYRFLIHPKAPEGQACDS
ncbi:MAG: hypothetical protein KIT79_15285 [Deltaproteobacteria bacterium]|nr:hypothetical protein [Deltaproteobacteria bacterium]